MKREVILALVLMNLTIGERRQRSTVLTDESKRILEQFDFSNFDKQEALNYLDRQRYDNQIRGKRSQNKLGRDRIYVRRVRIDDESGEQKDLSSNADERTSLKTKAFPPATRNSANLKSSKYDSGKDVRYLNMRNKFQGKRGRRSKKKRKFPTKEECENVNDNDYFNDEEEEENRYRKRKKKRKKKRHYWDSWTSWSSCSVTCGRGRKIRWRKCIVTNCTAGDLEMGEKTCQLPACNLLSKLFGL